MWFTTLHNYSFVKPVNDQIHIMRLEVVHTSTIGDVKEAIEDKYSISTKNTRVIFAGKVLSDNMTLSDYIIQKKSTLHLVDFVKQESNDDENDSSDDGADDGPKYPNTFVFMLFLFKMFLIM